MHWTEKARLKKTSPSFSASNTGVRLTAKNKMDIITRFWENQANRFVKIEEIFTITAFLGIVAFFILIEISKSYAFLACLIGFWAFGLKLVVSLFHPDDHGNSKIRNANGLIQFVFSLFYLVWFVGLTFMTVLVISKIIS